MTALLAERLKDAPRLAAPVAAKARLQSLLSKGRAATLTAFAAAPATRALLVGVADHSPYLWSLVAEDPARAARLLAASPETSLTALIDAVAARRDRDEDELKRALRRAKREAALLIALADLGGVWDVVATTEALTRFADAAVCAATDFLLRREAREGRLLLDAEAGDIQSRLRLRRAGARQARRARTQLFERHRPDRAVR